MAYERRGGKGGAKASTLNGTLAAGATSVPVSDLSTWAGANTTGVAYATINRGKSDEETVSFSGIGGGSLTGVVRGQQGTTDQAHASGATIELTSVFRDFDEANAHIADTTLDHHTQYARVDGTRTLTGIQTITRTSDGASLHITRGAASLEGASVSINRDTTAKAQSLSFSGGVAVNFIMGRAGSSDALQFGTYNGVSYAEFMRFDTARGVRIGSSVSLPTTGSQFVHLAMANIATAVTDTPASGGWLFVEGGALKYKGSGGTVTTLAVA